MIEIRVVRDLETAASLWLEISPRRVIFDDWNFRYGFFKYEPYPLCFRAAFEVSEGREELVALMPLVEYPEYGHGFISEEPCEENCVFVKAGHEIAIKLLYESLSKTEKTQFYDISGEDEYTKNLTLEDYKYVLPLSGFNNFSDFMAARLSPKRRHSLEKEIAAIEALNPEIIDNDFNDLDILFELNVGSFAGESYLTKEGERKPWRELIKEPFDWHLTSLRLEGKTVAVSLAVLYNGYWHYLLTGVAFKSYPGLGKFLNKTNIEKAISAGAKYFDAGLGDCGWKNLWHFDQIPQYEYLNF
ncbi:MAG: GNAT family N-acetyltransferase [Candidatus Falkowbacteria bacterium]